MLKNTTLTSQRTFIGLGIENKDEYNKLKQDETNLHIVYTNQTHVPDMKRVPGTQDFFQVQGHKEQLDNGNYKLDTFHLQCSCSNCRRNPQDVEACHYLQDRKWKSFEVSELRNKDNEIEYDKEYYENLTVEELKEVLREKNLPVSGQKDELIEQIMSPPEFSDKEAAECEEEESDDGDKSEDNK